ncbi:conserved hypothetical protein [Ricinus communis]|uniref:Uncharacterized protein n=1 Tax=Ricinus communis TaxID=3988 RepID=B9ST20_RICCO|nr:conserved hypothetical protein [Ricinus communis]
MRRRCRDSDEGEEEDGDKHSFLRTDQGKQMPHMFILEHSFEQEIMSLLYILGHQGRAS